MGSVQIADGRLFYMDKRKQKILDFAKNATEKHNTSVVFIYDGRSGMGKSTMAIQDGFYCDRTKVGFSLDKIYFTPEDFLVGLSTAEEHSYHLLDEAMVLSSRAAMSKLNKLMIKAMSMIRSKKIIVGLCINSIFDLDRNLALSRADFLFHCYGRNITERGRFLAFFKGKDGQDRIKLLSLIGKKFYSYYKPRANIRGKFSSRFLVDPREYEKKKQIGVNQSLLTKDPTRRRKPWMENFLYHMYKHRGMTQTEIGRIAGVTTAMVSTEISNYEQMQKEGELGLYR